MDLFMLSSGMVELPPTEPIRTLIIPNEFTWFASTGANIYNQGVNWFTDFDFLGLRDGAWGSECYVDPVNGSDSNPGTQASPYRRVHYVLDNTLHEVINLEPGIYGHDTGWRGRQPDRPIKMVVNGGGIAEFNLHPVQGISFSLGPEPNTFCAPNPQTARTFLSAFDRTNTDSNGVYIGMIPVNSEVEVSNTPNSFFYNETTEELCIRPWDSGRTIISLNENIVGNYDISNIDSAVTTEKFYMENIRVLGGGGMSTGAPFSLDNGSIIPRLVGINNCQFNHGGTKNGIDLFANANGFIANCRIDYNYKGDGVNYNAANGEIFEFNCHGINNGNYSGNTSNNGTTAHGSYKVIRLNCSYYESMGKVIHDINNTRVLMANCDAGNSLINPEGDEFTAAFASNKSTGSARMWLIDCRAHGRPLDIDLLIGSNSEVLRFDGNSGNLSSGIIVNEGGVDTLLSEAQVFN